MKTYRSEIADFLGRSSIKDSTIVYGHWLNYNYMF